MASVTLRLSITPQSASANKEPFFLSANPSRSSLTNCFLPRRPPSRSAGLRCSSRRRGSGKPAIKKNADQKNVGVDEVIDEDAFEALFLQLEEDLKNDELFGNDGGDEDISEEDLAKLEQELAEALEDDDLLGAFASVALGGRKSEDEDEDNDVPDDEDGSEIDDDDDVPLKLKNWQLRRLAYALKNGRRKTSIKNLAADLCLDRAVVLKLLRDPPPNLVMLSATLPDKPETPILAPVEERLESVPEESTTKPEAKVKVPIHVMQSDWSARKRLKKVQLETLEQVYRRSKRPTA
ncbi:hypothetical protein ACS0TY_021962 [Phlomoides rotata]